MTVSRPGGLVASADVGEPRPRPRVPVWVKVLAAVVAVVLIAVGNTAAKKRQERADRAAADRVDATLITTAGDSRDHEFDVSLLVVNRGPGPITVKAGRRVEPPLYDASSAADTVVGAGATVRLQVPFAARCPGQPAEPTQALSLFVPIAPASGRVRELSTELDALMMWDLSRRACGYLSADEAAVPSVRDVTSTRYAVHFKMLLANVSDRRFELVDLTSPGLALSVMGGVPLGVLPNSSVDLEVSAALPACSRLPAPGPRGRGGTQQYGTIVLQLFDEAQELQSKPYLPNADLSAALAGLRARICPGSLLGPSRSRPRGFA